MSSPYNLMVLAILIGVVVGVAVIVGVMFRWKKSRPHLRATPASGAMPPARGARPPRP